MTSTASRLAAIVAALALPASAFAWDTNCKFNAERAASLGTENVARVEVLARAGDLRVEPAQGAVVSAKGRACASSQSYLDRTLLRVEKQGDVLQVRVLVPEEMKGIGIFYASLDLTVSVPASLPVTVTDSSGDMTLDGVKLARVTDSSGDIHARRVAGDFAIDDSSGDIRVEYATGGVRVTDSSGDIVIRGAQDVEVTQDSSGDITIEHIGGSVRIVQDSSGDISVADVARDVAILGDTSGHVQVSEVRGTVQVP
jgi:hypothetical protein